MKVQSKGSVLTLANATTLAAGILGQLMGSRLTDTLGGTRVSQQALHDLVGSCLNKNINSGISQKV